MQFRLPDLGEGIVDAELVEWLVQPGQTVQHGENLAEVMTDKASLELPAPFSGKIGRLLVEPGQQVKVGEVMLEYEAAAAAGTAATPAATESVAQAAAALPAAAPRAATTAPAGPRSPAAAKPAAPSVRRMARQLDIDLAEVAGSGPHNRVLIDDLAAYVKATRGPADAVTSPPPPADRGEYRPGSRIKMRGLRRKIAERMVHAKQTIPHYTYVDQCDVSELVRLRQSLKDQFAEAGIKLTYLPFFVKAVVGALREVPLANAALDEEAGEIVLHDRYHIGIATDTDGGLLVPVLRDADRRDLPEIARDIHRLTAAARTGKATPDELRGSTFTITSIGGVGGLISTPIINAPEVGILGIGRIVKRPEFDEHDTLRAAHVVYLSFSFDHRVVDGAVAARLANAVIRRLQNPAALLLPAQM